MRNAIFEKKNLFGEAMWTQNLFGAASLTNPKFSSINSSLIFDAFSARRYNFHLRVYLAPLRAILFRLLT